jgi:iron complex transport system substrate-binding protein
MRIVSLLPSLTEICFVLGLENDLVAVTHECDYPPATRSLPHITRTILPPDLIESVEIDRRVKAAISEGRSLYELDVDRLIELEPDLILTQDLCQVCAVSIEDVRAIAERIPSRPRVVSIEPRTLEEMLQSIGHVGELTGRNATARAVIEALRTRLARIAAYVARTEHRYRVVCLEWLDPPMVAGHWVPEMVSLAGGNDPLGIAAEPSFEVGWQQVIDARPDVMVLMPCGFDLETTVADVERLAKVHDRLPEGLEQVPAVTSGHVYAVDGSGFFNRPGPRLVSGVEILAGILHAELAATYTPSGTVDTVNLARNRPRPMVRG